MAKCVPSLTHSSSIEESQPTADDINEKLYKQLAVKL